MRYRLPIIALLAFLIGGLVALAMQPGLRNRLLPDQRSIGQALVGGHFSLVNQDGTALITSLASLTA